MPLHVKCLLKHTHKFAAVFMLMGWLLATNASAAHNALPDTTSLQQDDEVLSDEILPDDDDISDDAQIDQALTAHIDQPKVYKPLPKKKIVYADGSLFAVAESLPKNNGAAVGVKYGWGDTQHYEGSVAMATVGRYNTS